ncbi:putative wall-associated receptor kinase-like 16 [Rosa sericea]
MATLQGILLIIQLSFVIIGVLIVSTTAAAPQALPNCPDKCGNLTVPYPFGMAEGCYRGNAFFVKCSQATDPPIAYLTKNGTVIITNISLAEGELQISYFIARDCYSASALRTRRNSPVLRLSSPYTISDTKNKFIAVGCDTYAIFKGFQGTEQSITGCMSVCNSLESVDQNSCSGDGCCQTNIPSGLHNRTVTLDSYSNHSGIWDFNPCSFAFIVEETQFKFSGNTSFQKLNSTTRLPMVLNWAIGDEPDPCDVAQKRQDFVCKQNSMCVNPTNRNGYICQCLEGYEGNPYHPDGCQDIDECKDPNLCNHGECKNFAGSYSCLCSKGYKIDSMNDKSCIKENPKNKSKMTLLLIISLSVSIGLLVLFVGISWICCGIKRRQYTKLKEKYFKENGGLLLLQQLASHGGTVDTTKIFSTEELEKATNNYHESRILGEGGYGTVYKGILPDDKVVAIKKSKGGAPTQSDQFVNEVIVLSQINHKNVVKLLGCCLETEVPLLVYEFITHGTLYEHIHKKRSSLSFELRMKIAVETAEALAYLHSSTSNPIIHRDVKAENILLDDAYTAKVSDFGASRLVPSGQTEIQTLVLGTFGYLDPEYLQSNQLTEKSDIYSFGVVLVELLTSKVALSKDRCLTSIFISSMDEDCLSQILDDDIVNEGNIETVKNVASLAKRCLRS